MGCDIGVVGLEVDGVMDVEYCFVVLGELEVIGSGEIVIDCVKWCLCC